MPNFTMTDTITALAQGPVFVIIRFPLTRFQAAKNSLAKNFSVHKVYMGAVAGLSKDVQVIEGSWPYNKGIAILSFQSYKEAELWRNSVPEIRQQDWLDGVDLVIVPVQKLPKSGRRFVQILEVSFKNLDEFMREYSVQANNHMESFNADGSVVATDKILKAKGQWQPEFLIINFWKSVEDFDAAYNSDAYQPIKQKRLMCAEANSVVFELAPLFREY